MVAADSATDGAARLRTLLERGATAAQAWELFDSLPAVRVEEITTGRWRGDEVPSGHPWDGMLVETGWYGKQFDSADSVQPLLFAGPDGDIFAVDPRRVPLFLAGKVPTAALRPVRRSLGLLRPMLRTRTPRARLRNLEFRGKSSAAMIYDHLPIIDIFRRVDQDTLLGVMDMRGLDAPYFFVLYRDR
ncbi:DUF4334 domain-containing protein [Nocardia seriolae]|nr:DUF4334 domain-containing protein [Nocardia seriolae]APA98141.1 hypothetical protein NS506_04093 [Nocardia seriolae]MTJ62826.1 DUF4334 domain-containing protein [Nocardia seriolae]MTJ73502.1 DUF4334 domain-containing protein [Nocardia seriolae]MTJ87860.1 DUF4334 domain-containing protein [Nocardia seriolae]MTK31853.1 DUF4334 domain-containing protein [Nocardia seriolae]